jgi:hypothetical protein
MWLTYLPKSEHGYVSTPLVNPLHALAHGAIASPTSALKAVGEEVLRMEFRHGRGSWRRVFLQQSVAR